MIQSTEGTIVIIAIDKISIDIITIVGSINTADMLILEVAAITGLNHYHQISAVVASIQFCSRVERYEAFNTKRYFKAFDVVEQGLDAVRLEVVVEAAGISSAVFQTKLLEHRRESLEARKQKIAVRVE